MTKNDKAVMIKRQIDMLKLTAEFLGDFGVTNPSLEKAIDTRYVKLLQVSGVKN